MKQGQYDHNDLGNKMNAGRMIDNCMEMKV